MTTAQPAFVLALVSDPDLALILVFVGILLIYAEFNRPGTVILACLGTFSSTIGVYALAQHHIDPMFLALAAVGIAMTGLHLLLPLKNIMAILGYVMLLVSVSNLLPGSPAIHVKTAAITTALFVGITHKLGEIALRARRNKRLPYVQVKLPHPTLHPATE